MILIGQENEIQNKLICIYPNKSKYNLAILSK